MPSTDFPQSKPFAQTAASAGDGLAIVKTHHAAIAKAFEELLATGMKAGAPRDAALKKLAHQLTAHAVAEENVLYPALAMNGMTSESDKLYLDHAHAKVMNGSSQQPRQTSSREIWTKRNRYGISGSIARRKNACLSGCRQSSAKL